MKLLFIHGPPAAGKLTIAKAIQSRVEGKLFDNHVPIDFARTIFEFGTPPFWELVNEARYLAIEKAAAARVPFLIITGCYSDPHDRPFLEKIESILSLHGDQLLPVFLSCSPEVLRSRVTSSDRVSRPKLSSVEGLNKLLEEFNLTQIPRYSCLCIDSGILSPDLAAEKIIEHFKIRPI